jgi:hypothetical protein
VKPAHPTLDVYFSPLGYAASRLYSTKSVQNVIINMFGTVVVTLLTAKIEIAQTGEFVKKLKGVGI